MYDPSGGCRAHDPLQDYVAYDKIPLVSLVHDAFRTLTGHAGFEQGVLYNSHFQKVYDASGFIRGCGGTFASVYKYSDPVDLEENILSSGKTKLNVSFQLPDNSSRRKQAFNHHVVSAVLFMI